MISKAISVIVPTMCSSPRKHLLRRAIDSITRQGDLVKEIIVVINGSAADKATLDWLEQQLLIDIEYLPEASLSAAIRHGRTCVAAPYFAFLDDDDVYLPGALALRLEAIEGTGADLVATNGYRENGEAVVLNGSLVVDNALRALSEFNWLASCGGLFRSSSVPVGFFDTTTKYTEWTLLAFKIARAGLEIRFLEEFTFQLTAQPDSLWRAKKLDALMEHLAGTNYMVAHAPRHMRHNFNQLRKRLLHMVSEKHLDLGNRRAAWQWHLRCLACGGFEFITYTRHLLLPLRQTKNNGVW